MILQDLETQYGDPDAEATYHRKFDDLIQGTKPFREFISDFQHYARLAEIPEKQQIRNLREKLTPAFQDHFVTHKFTNLQDFISALHTAAQHMELSQETRNTVNSRRGNNSTRGRGGANFARPGSNRSPPRNQGNAPQRSITNPAPATARPPFPVPRGTCANCLRTGCSYRTCKNPAVAGAEDRIRAVQEALRARQAQVNAIQESENDDTASSTQGNE